MSHQHVKELVRYHDHRRHRECPTCDAKNIRRCALAGRMSVLTVSVSFTPKVSSTYRTRVLKLSTTYRSHGVNYVPELHTVTKIRPP
jgi:hypothetical protein